MTPDKNTSNINKSQFWNNKYLENESKWDIGNPTPAFVDYFKLLSNKNKKILVPGCGNGYDALYLAKLGFDVYAVDFSKEAINYILEQAKNQNISINVLHEDFFKLNNFDFFFDIVLEYTFFCAISPDRRQEYIEKICDLLKKNGEYVGFLLPIDKNVNEPGPPFGIDLNETLNDFSKYFSIKECTKSSLSIEPRINSEIFIKMIKC